MARSSEATDGDNGAQDCTDEMKRQFYRDALLLRVAHEAAVKEAKSKLAAYRLHLKEAKKKGGDAFADAIAKTLSVRFEDQDVLVVRLREQMKVLDLSGVVPHILDKILDRFSIEEPTANEAHQTMLDRAWDDGQKACSAGAIRDENPHTPPGSDEFDAWDRGWKWLDVQSKTAAEMARGAPPPALAPAADRLRGARKSAAARATELLNAQKERLGDGVDETDASPAQPGEAFTPPPLLQ